MTREARWKLLSRDAALFNYHRNIIQKFLNHVKKHSIEHRMREAFVRLRFNKQTALIMEAKRAGKQTDWDWFGFVKANDIDHNKQFRRVSTVHNEVSDPHYTSPQSSKPVMVNDGARPTNGHSGRRVSTVHNEVSDPHYTSPQSSKPVMVNGGARPTNGHSG